MHPPSVAFIVGDVWFLSQNQGLPLTGSPGLELQVPAPDVQPSQSSLRPPSPSPSLETSKGILLLPDKLL